MRRHEKRSISFHDCVGDAVKAFVQISEITYTRADPVEQMAKVLNVDKSLEVDAASVKTSFAEPSGLPATALPEGDGLEVRKKVTGRVNSALPFAKNFFERVGVDILIAIWEYVHQGKLTEMLPLIMSSKAIYSRMQMEPDLLLQIAKGNFTFIYLTRAKPFRNFHELLAYAQPSSGAELAFNHYATQQILRNSRMLRKPFFEIRIKLWPRHVFQGQGMCVIKCFCQQKTVERLHALLTKFEEVHNAIAMKIFMPYRNHYPFALHDSSLYVHSIAPLDYFDRKKSAILATVRIRFTVNNMRYRFSLLAKHFSGAA